MIKPENVISAMYIFFIIAGIFIILIGIVAYWDGKTRLEKRSKKKHGSK